LLLASLTTPPNVVTIANMSAELLFRQRLDFDDGAILEIIVWRVPKPVSGCRHGFKYRLFYGYAGQRLIAYDNERPKGDHRHHGKTEEAYVFETPEKLIDDFLRDVDEWRSKK